MGRDGRRTGVRAAAAIWTAATFLGPPAAAQNDLGLLSDEFDHPGTLSNWSRLHVAEQWNAEQLETWDVGVTDPGRMTMVPYTVVWYQDWVGPYAFKIVRDDFVLTIDATVTGRDGTSVPQSIFSLGGIMIRRPRAVTPATWTPGGENYVFLSVGYGNATPPRFQFEVKTTVNSASTLILSNAPGPTARLQVARLGPYVITLRREPQGAWVVHRRFARPDFPETLQASLVSYTDWGKAQHFDPYTHNRTALDPPLPPNVTDPRPDIPFVPDALARFEYARYFRPTMPPQLAGRDLSDPAQVSDAELLSFLGEEADVPGPDLTAVPSDPGARAFGIAAEPNPFRDRVWFSVRLEEPGPVRVSVFDVSGRLVRALPMGYPPGHRPKIRPGPASAGVEPVVWDGRDDGGRRVAAGIYLVRAWTARGYLTTRVCSID